MKGADFNRRVPMADTPSASSRPNNTGRGLLFMVGATLSNAIMAAMVKNMSGDLHPFELAFFRNLFGLLAFAPVFIRYGLAPLHTGRLGLHAMRGTLNVVTMLSYFTALGLVPLATIAAIDFSGPLFATVLAIVILGEKLRKRRIIALIIGFVGGLIVLRPGIIEIQPGVLIAVFSAFVWGGILIVLKTLTKTETSVTATLYMAIFATPLTFVAALPFWTTPSLEQLLWLTGIGISGTITHVLVAQSLREADTTAVMPANFTRLLWAILLGYLIFGEIPDFWTIFGGTMIFAAVSYIAYRERESGRKVEPTISPTPPV